MATIVIFASSLFTASALLAVKAVEIKYGKRNFILKLLSNLDSKSDKLISDLKFMGLQLIQSIRYIALVQIKALCKNLLDKVEQKIMDEYKAGHTVIVGGRKDIVSKGSVSFYLKKITEEKSNGQKGKIE